MFQASSFTAAVLLISAGAAGPASPDGAILSASFGADNAFPAGANRLVCRGAVGRDGMPVVFSEELERTPRPDDFRVTSPSGEERPVTCVTFDPADDPGERRTALLVGEFGGPEDPPARVEVIRPLRSMDRRTGFHGASASIAPLEAGPSIVMAEQVSRSDWKNADAGTPIPWGGGTACPWEGTEQIVRVVWSGGVVRPDRTEVGDEEREAYTVTLRQRNGRLLNVTPFAFGDLNDGDNNHELCLQEAGVPVAVSFEQDRLADPNGDLNVESRVLIQRAR
ncbi:hypothetical protein ACWCOP_00400 [Maricaulaceae bacterium MS644]